VRPVTEFALARSRVDQNPRFRDENILLLDLDLPERTTEDYAGPSVDPLVQAALDNALRDDGDLELDASKPVDFISACVFFLVLFPPALALPARLTAARPEQWAKDGEKGAKGSGCRHDGRPPANGREWGWGGGGSPRFGRAGRRA
jgi:hypothetical protein